MTNEEILEVWNSGAYVATCSMGGMSDAYEQTIQTIVFVMFKAMLDDPPDWPLVTGTEGIDHWFDYCKKMQTVPEVKDVIKQMNPSAAQVGAAVSLASTFAENGYEEGLKKIPKHRRIEAHKYISEEPPSQQATSASHQPTEPEQQEQ